MIELHKIMNGFTKFQKDQLFELRNGVQMAHGNVYLNLYKHHKRLDIKNFFTERVPNDWNKFASGSEDS
jgi:hypothetical protein